MTTLAKTPVSKTFYLSTAWNGRKYSQSADAPEVPAPSALTAVADGNVVSLTWADESSGSAGAVIQRSPNGSTGWSQVGSYAAGVLAAEDVVSAGTYYYRALGIFRGLTSETPSSTADVTVVAPVPAPASFLATVDSYDITLSWIDESGGTAQHVIQNSADGSTGWSTIATKSTGVTSHSITGLSDGTYYYRIYATSGGNNSGYVYANATIDTPLSAPSNFTAQASGTTVSFSWTDNNGGTAQTRIEVSTTSGSTGFSTLTTVSSGVTTYQATSVAADDYWYRALAVDGGDTSPNTAAVAVTVSTGSGGGVGISSITGTVADGATVTVNGGSFGTMGGDVLGYIRGDEYATNTTVSGTTPTVGGSVSTNIVGVGSDTTGDYLRYSSSASRGNKARGIRRVHTGTVTGVYRPGGFGFTGLNTTKYYATYYRRPNVTWATTNTYNYKHYYTFGNSSTNPQTMLFIPARGNTFGFYNNNPLSSDSYSVQNMSNTAGWNGSNEANTWHRWEIYADYANTPTTRNGVLRVWRNRTLGITSDTWIGRGPGLGDTTYTTQWFLGYMDLNLEGSWDHTDVYFADTPARVELGNASTWSACTQTELQLARNANWSDTAISSVTINYGAFTSGQTVYMYVIKSDGQPVSNSGYAVVLP